MAYTQDDFQEWIFWMTFKMDYFTGDFAKENNLNLDYSAKSLDDLENWILNNFDDPKELRTKDDGKLIDYLLIYIGETFRKYIGGKWFIDLENMKDKYYSMPVLKIEKNAGDVYISPMTYAAACIHMKKGNYISSILRDYMEDKGNDSQKVDPTKTVDEIEKAVYAKLKPQGFRKFGRTLHRFVSEDISQVINFQIGSPTGSLRGHMCVNVGLRIPECVEKTFHPETNKKYYHEYECTFRKRLEGETGRGANVQWFDLTKDTQKITADIIKQIEDKVIPAFDALCNRGAILEHGEENLFFNFPGSRNCNLYEAMIYGHLGNMEKAKEIFEVYYQIQVDGYNEKLTNGTKHYLKKGQRLIYMGQDITAEKDGYVTVYGANHGYIDTLDKLAVKLGLR